MLIAAQISAILLLALVAAQDFRSRLISWWLIPLLFAALVLGGISVQPFGRLAEFFALNILLLAAQGMLLLFWYRLRLGRWSNIIDSAIGLGDILFLVCMAAAFSTFNFIAAFVTGLIVALLVFPAVRLFRPQIPKEIPLAGILSLLMIVMLAWKIVQPQTDFYSDAPLLSLFL